MTKARDLADGVINTAELADGSITTAKIADGDITDAKLATGISASKLTGALPAISGASLTGISAGLPGPRAEVFTSSGTFTVPSGVTAVKVTVVGGGAAGGATGNSANVDFGAGGGGAGGVAIKWITGLTPGGTETVTVGAGGTSTTTTSTAGGTSSFGSHCSATGGAAVFVPTGGGYPNYYTPGSEGGVGSGGDLNMSGGWGGYGQYNSGPDQGFGGGGGSPMGAHGAMMATADNSIIRENAKNAGAFGGYAGKPSYAFQTGDSATGYGCGGGGGAQTSSTLQAGGAGYQGIVIVEY